MDDQLRFFADNGYLVLRDALTDEEVSAANDAIEADRTAYPEHWEPGLVASGHLAVGCDAPELLHRTEALDGFVQHPSIVPLVDSILGPGAKLSGLTYLVRESCLVQPPGDLDDGEPLGLTRVWHREDSGNIEGAEMNEFFAPALQAIIYLDDVDEETHCFSIIPESAETKRQLPKSKGGSNGWGAKGCLRIDDSEDGYLDPKRPKWADAFGQELTRRSGGVNIHSRAGSAVVLNNSSWHCGTIRHTQRRRRTLHVRYRQPEPVASRHGLKSPWESVAQFTAALPSRLGMGKV